MLGLPVFAELVQAGFAVTALVRDRGKARRILSGAADIVNADIRDVDSLIRGLAGQDAVYLNLSVLPDAGPDDFHTEREGLSNILAAAKSAGVKRIAYVSALVRNWGGSPWWIIDLWNGAVDDIKASGVPYTIFYPTLFMETLPTKHLHGSVLVVTGTPRVRHYWIAGADFGKQVAASFRIASAVNRDYVVQGPEPLDFDECAHRFASSYKRPLRVIKLPLLLFFGLGLFSRGMQFNARITQIMLQHPEDFGAAETWRDLGTPTITIGQFARDLGRSSRGAV